MTDHDFRARFEAAVEETILGPSEMWPEASGQEPPPSLVDLGGEA
jgi:hypothetical protein